MKRELDDNTKRYIEEELLPLLRTGRENCVSMSFLCTVLGISESTLKSVVLRAKKSGYIIARARTGEYRGYFIPKDDTELLDYYLRERRHALSTLESLTPVRRLLKEHGIDTGGK